MKILTKTEAAKRVNFKTTRKIRFDLGKYKNTVIGRDLPTNHAERMQQEHNFVWGEHRKDKDGPYIALFCICK